MIDRDARLAEAVRLRESGRPAEARELLVVLAQELPDDAQVAYQAAWVHDTLGLESAAEPHYRRALAIPGGLSAEDRADALLGLGSTYRVLGRYQQAVETLTAASAEFPENGALRAFLAMALFNVGRHHDAMELLLTLVATTSDDPNVAEYRPAIEHYAQDLHARVAEDSAVPPAGSGSLP
ncbi:tetratricopeptide repeat protein [Streptomyces cavernicola]|uniref:Tetratricopeptide repeat protein n=1 Tax=Streptomyces cavernicola TaxID=3043613 RepID=A0ABT6S7V7_9ACTN|nr:tetratricopeptide repeat protein [Streptomyces sp. B-S-A6]MDI3404122.1 tetratricopeptide repeat protein [Streptomyces sp. B-S-A6]